MSHHRSAGKNHNLVIPNKAFANAVYSIHLGTTLTNKNWIHEEIQSYIKFRECLLPFSSEYFVFPSPV